MDALKITVVSGFLGAGKTTLIKHFIQQHAFGPNPILVENDYGSLGIDSKELSGFGVEIKDLTAGCICCSLKGDFLKAISKVLEAQQFSHVVIEPSGVGKLSDILGMLREPSFVQRFGIGSITAITIVDARRFKENNRYVTEYFWNQIQNSRLLLLNRTESLDNEELKEIYDILHENHISFPILNGFTPDNIDFIQTFLDTPPAPFQPMRQMGKKRSIPGVPTKESRDNRFKFWSTAVTRSYTREQLESILKELEDTESYGKIYRAKGIVDVDGESKLFDYVPNESEIREFERQEEGMILVIGENLQAENLSRLFFQ